MKNLFLALFFLANIQSSAQGSLAGAWEWTQNEEGRIVKGVLIMTEKYQVASWFDAKTGAFIRTNGGKYWADGNKITEQVEFDSQNPERVGEKPSFEIEWNGPDKMRIVGMKDWVKRVDSGKPGVLAGAWLMSGRKRDGVGEVQSRSMALPRKTMKMLSGSRFQWIAYNTETKEFKGTGGGTYTTVDGVYTENIEFFSRDDSRVGASLPFNYDLVDGDWHHSGNSSKGNPLYEVWSLRPD